MDALCAFASQCREMQGELAYAQAKAQLVVAHLDRALASQCCSHATWSMAGRELSTIDWDQVRVFLAVARAGQLAGAAARLGLDISTVSRRIDRLESEL